MELKTEFKNIVCHNSFPYIETQMKKTTAEESDILFHRSLTKVLIPNLRVKTIYLFFNILIINSKCANT